MSITLERARELTEQLSREIQRRSGEAERNRDYFEGAHPLKFLSEQFSGYFGDRYEGFSDNWCDITASSPAERLNPIGIRVEARDDGSPTMTDADAALWEVWKRNEAEADVGMAFIDSIVARRAFGMVWGNDDDNDTPEVTFESATDAIVAYEPGSRRKRAAGLKLWRDDQNEYATLYTPDEVWRLIRRQGVPEVTPGGIFTVTRDRGTPAWQLRGEEEDAVRPNPLGAVPLVELPNRPLLSREPLSDISGVMAMQDAINMLWAQLFVASDFASFKQRVVLGAEPPKLPILNERGQVVGSEPIPLEKFAVNRVVWLSDPNAKIGEWTAADLAVWTGVIEVAIGHIAAQTRTPQHYLIGKMANLAAAALKAAETGLIMRTGEKQLYGGICIREMFRLMTLAQGKTERAKAVAASTVLWRNTESRSDAEMADALLKKKQVGYPFEYLAELDGLSPTEIRRVLAMRERDMATAMFNPGMSDPANALDDGQDPAENEPAPRGPDIPPAT